MSEQAWIQFRDEWLKLPDGWTHDAKCAVHRDPGAECSCFMLNEVKRIFIKATDGLGGDVPDGYLQLCVQVPDVDCETQMVHALVSLFDPWFYGDLSDIAQARCADYIAMRYGSGQFTGGVVKAPIGGSMAAADKVGGQ